MFCSCSESTYEFLKLDEFAYWCCELNHRVQVIINSVVQAVVSISIKFGRSWRSGRYHYLQPL